MFDIEFTIDATLAYLLYALLSAIVGFFGTAIAEATEFEDPYISLLASLVAWITHLAAAICFWFGVCAVIGLRYHIV